MQLMRGIMISKSVEISRLRRALQMRHLAVSLSGPLSQLPRGARFAIKASLLHKGWAVHTDIQI